MKRYNIKITGTSGLVSDSDNGFTDCVEIFRVTSDTVEQYARERNSSVLFRVELQFKINTDTKKFAKELFEWSKLTDSKEIYRDFEITIKDETKESLRHIAIKQMFVEDYSEVFDEINPDASGKTRSYANLKIVQKVGNIKNISND